MSFKNILFYANGSAGELTAFQQTIELARDNRAQLTVMGVVDHPPHFDDTAIKSSLTFHELLEFATRDEQERLAALVGSCNSADVQIATDVACGTAFVELIRDVIRNERDLLVKASEAAHGLGERIFGTTARKLMRKCPCPVWVLKPAHGPVDRIAAAIDISHKTEAERKLNEHVLRTAISLARLKEGKVTAIHVWRHWGESLLRGPGRLREGDIQEILAEIRIGAFDAVTELIAPFRRECPMEMELIKGVPELVIPEFCQEQEIDVLVMGTVARTGLTGFLIGNTAEKILDEIDCSVVTLKPEGFVSPIA